MCSTHQTQQWDLPESKLGALNTTDRRVLCTNKQGSRITRNNKSDHSATSDVWHTQGEKQGTRRGRLPSAEREGTSSTDMGRKTNLITLLDLCVSSQHCLPTLSHNSAGHGGRCDSGCSRMFISTHRLKTAVVRRVVLSTKL